MGKLDGKVAIVAGSSRGTGRGIALAYGKEGAKVAVVARTETEGAIPGTIGKTAAEIRALGGVAIPVRCDVANGGEVEAMVRAVERALGPVDILCNSTVVIAYEDTVRMTEESWSRLFDVNVKGAFLLTRAVLPGMMERRRGSIIHLTGRGAIDARLVKPSVGASKAALEQFVRGVALEAKAYDIAVNCLDPGPVKSEGAVARRPKGFDFSGAALPEAIGPLGVYMAGLTASTLTGQVVRQEDFVKGGIAP